MKALILTLLLATSLPGRDMFRTPPLMTEREMARLETARYELKGRQRIYSASGDSGRTVSEAILLDSANCATGIDDSRHLLESRYPGAKIAQVREFRIRNRYYHEWRVQPVDGRPTRIFIDATYWHLVL